MIKAKITRGGQLNEIIKYWVIRFTGDNEDQWISYFRLVDSYSILVQRLENLLTADAPELTKLFKLIMKTILGLNENQ